MSDNPKPERARSRTPGAVFLAVGVVFLVVGNAGQRAFIAIGIIFLALGAALLVRAPREKQP